MKTLLGKNKAYHLIQMVKRKANKHGFMIFYRLNKNIKKRAAKEDKEFNHIRINMEFSYKEKNLSNEKKYCFLWIF